MIAEQSRRIRVLKFLNHFYVGGTERQFIHIANGLDRTRFDVDVACLKREGPLLETLHEGIPVHTYPVRRNFYSSRSVLSQFRLMKDVRKRPFDIVHAYGWYPNVFAIPASRLAFRPAIIASVRDVGAYMTPAKIHALKFVCSLADCVLANSSAGRDWLVEQGVRARKIEVIHNGIVVPPLVERARGLTPMRQEFRIASGQSVCACIGRVVSGKGIDFFLQAARILADRGRDVRFLMVGGLSVEQNYQSDMKSLASRLNLDDRVIFTGERRNISEILREVDIVVHPSLTEGLSNVILEAMAASVPVVATRVGGNPELVEDGRSGLLVATQNAIEIADAVCRLLDQPAMARSFGERGRQRVIEEFALERMISKTEALYVRLFEGRLALTPRNQVDLPDHESNPFIN